MYRLTSLSLSGFRSIREMSGFELSPLNVLIGANGAGKSNLIGFFRMLGQLATGNLQLWIAKQGGAASLLFDGPAVTPDLRAHLVFESEAVRYEYQVRLTHAAGDTLVFAEERCRASRLGEDQEEPFVDLGAGHRETRLGELPALAAQNTKSYLQYCSVYRFQNMSETSRIHNRWRLSDSDELKEDAGNLAAVLCRLKRGNRDRTYQRIVETLRLSIPWFDDFHLIEEDGTVLLRWRERGSDLVFGSQQAAEGTLRLMALTTLLFGSLDPPFLILLDEPELGLHPAALANVCGMIRAASRRCQIVVATQSTAVLDQFAAADVVTVKRTGRESIYERVDPERLREWLEEYSLGELWEKNVLAAGPYP